MTRDSLLDQLDNQWADLEVYAQERGIDLDALVKKASELFTHDLTEYSPDLTEEELELVVQDELRYDVEEPTVVFSCDKDGEGRKKCCL